MSHAQQLKFWPEQEPDDYDVVTATVAGGVVWKRYRDGKIIVTQPGETPREVADRYTSAGNPQRLPQASTETVHGSRPSRTSRSPALEVRRKSNEATGKSTFRMKHCSRHVRFPYTEFCSPDD